MAMSACASRPGAPWSPAPTARPWSLSPRWRCGGTRPAASSGFSGSGPAQLAMALLLDHTGDPDLAQTHHQRFKADVVARWRGKEWTLEPREIDAWLAVATA